MPRTPKPPQARSVMEVDWPFFGELCRGLALKVTRDYEPDLVVGIARAGVIPGAIIASIMRCDFASITTTRLHEGEAPALVSLPTLSPKGRKVLLVDETCDSGDTMRLAASVMKEEGAQALKTAVSFRCGVYKPDFWALQTGAFIILPWDRWVVNDGELVIRPDYEEALAQAAGPGAQGHGDAEAAGTEARGHGGTGRAKPAARRSGR
jgi:hypoxanthine phosphoribosyltransferase